MNPASRHSHFPCDLVDGSTLTYEIIINGLVTHSVLNFTGTCIRLIIFNTSRPSDAYMRQETKHHWFR